MSNARELAQIPSTPSGRRNLIINGAMNVAQRGDEFTGHTSAYGPVDRYYVSTNTTNGVTVSQESDAPAGFSNSLKILVTTANTSPESGLVFQMHQGIEAQNLQHLEYNTSTAKTVTVSFYVKSNKTGTYQFNLRNQDADRMYSKTYTINAADTWEYKTFSFEGDATGVLNNDNGEGLKLNWWFASGSTYNSGSAPSAWEAKSNGDLNGSGTVNLLDTLNNYIQFTGVQLEVGSVATEFEHRSFGEELALCQRYYQDYVFTGSTLGLSGRAASSTDSTYISIPTKVEMRTSPSLTFSGGWTSTSEFTGTLISYATTSNVITAKSTNTASGPTVRWVRGGTIFVDAEL